MTSHFPTNELSTNHTARPLKQDTADLKPARTVYGVPGRKIKFLSSKPEMEKKTNKYLSLNTTEAKIEKRATDVDTLSKPESS
ncbi:hypothetical protein BaRGS_00001773 [Batillaria attramentaria]|uniref:Uncharacterized protein n=1 Tax=Batillaria attramentaria TaxID=370345 RepID=A0ABD0M6K3_9CAEN